MHAPPTLPISTTCCREVYRVIVGAADCTTRATERTEVCLTTIQFGVAQISKYLHNCIDFLSGLSVVQNSSVRSFTPDRICGHRFCITNFRPFFSFWQTPSPKCRMHRVSGLLVANFPLYRVVTCRIFANWKAIQPPARLAVLYFEINLCIMDSRWHEIIKIPGQFIRSHIDYSSTALPGFKGPEEESGRSRF